MAQGLLSPQVLLSDEEVTASPLLESTAAEFGSGLRKDLLSDFSAISPNLGGAQQAVSEDNNEKVKVYLRVRPLKPSELEKQEDQGCVCIENSETLLLRAPQDSFTMRSTARRVGQAVHKFTFTQVGAQALYANSLSMVFQEEVLTPLKRSHSAESQLQAATNVSFDSGVGGLSSTSQFVNQSSSSQLEELGPRWADLDRISLLTPGDGQVSIWVSFFEIYNDQIYDLLEMPLPGQNRKRQTLRLCEDQTGSPYVKDLNWINVQDADEAWKLLKLGRKNQSFACTHLNENSSRSHSIFSIRILHLQGSSSEMLPKISELSLCDLAGSERCKNQKSGDRMKEANNINTSLHTLGRCIAALRQNQQSKLKQGVVPFRDSKLTRVFQGFFMGRGRSCMIVNINQCASTYDETLHVAKFSAIASQLVQAPPTKLALPSIQSLMKEHSRRDSRSLGAGSKQEVEPDEDSEDDEVSMYDWEDLPRAVEVLWDLLVQERQDRLHLEMRLREELCNEMLEQLQQKEQWCSQHLDTQKELLVELYEDKLNNLKESMTDYYQERIQERDEKIEELEAALQEAKLQSEALERKQQEQPLRRSKRVVAASTLQQELLEVKAKLEQCQSELTNTTAELHRYQKLLEPPPSAKPLTVDVDRKLEDGQKNVKLLRSELQRLGESLQSAERACCHTTSAGKLREALCTCDDILARQDQTLAELQNNMMLVKLDLRKKATCIAEQYHTVQKLQAPSTSTLKKRFCANRENLQPSQPPGKKPFLHSFLSRSPTHPHMAESSPYSCILRGRRSPALKALPSSKKY
nr:kinesin-like protein KIF20A [Chelonoidis abingdonii]